MADDYISLHTGQEIDKSIDRKVVDLDAVPKINEGDNFNNYITPGVFGIASNAIATSLYNNGNCPSKFAGRLIVVSAVGNAISSSSSTILIRQIYETYQGLVYQRRANTYTGVANLEWQSWALVYGVDAVVESGVSGSWRYRKWANGIAECWCSYLFQNEDVTTVWGPIYESSGHSLSYPSGLFVAVDSCIITPGGRSTRSVMLDIGGTSSNATHTPTFWFSRATTATGIDIDINCHAIGRWK